MPSTAITLLRHLRVEDLLLALVAVFGAPVFAALSGGSTGGDSTDSGPGVLGGIIGLVALAGVIACLCTRGPDEPAPLADGTMTLQGWSRFPLAAGIAITSTELLPGIGVASDPLVGLTFVVMVVTAIAHPRLPVVPVGARRAMVLPISLLAAGAFDRIIGGDLPDIVGGLVRGDQPELLAFAPLIVGAIATMYVMLVVAPRSIADPGASGLAWTLRFLFLLGAVAVGSLLGG